MSVVLKLFFCQNFVKQLHCVTLTLSGMAHYKGKSKEDKLQKRKVEFPVSSIKDILNPFDDTRRAGHERQAVFRQMVKNQPTLLRTQANDILIGRPVPTVADTDEYLAESYQQVYHSDPKAKPEIGEENDKKKILPARDGGRLNKLSVKEVYSRGISKKGLLHFKMEL
jgi:hypothetical protein